MKRVLKNIIICMLLFSGCSKVEEKVDAIEIKLSDEIISVDGKAISKDSTQAVYASNDIIFYLANQDFTYGEGGKEDEHEQSEADAHTVVHITKPGTYALSGKLSLGQIAIDLKEEAKNNPNAVVTLILDNVDITCSVAPAIIFYNVYECGNSEEESATKDVDTTKAGANVIIADDSENNINGSYVAKIYKSYELNEEKTEVIDSKKLHKYDAAFYSKMTMNINGGKKGNGILNIKAENEGLDSELHLTINGGIINITSGNDGINTNEDNVSVTTINGGTLNILCDGSTGEGDGIDSNGWLVINGGSLRAQACANSGDAGIDSDKGIYINGGSIMASGNMLDHIAGKEATYAVFHFANRQDGNSTYTLKNEKEEIIAEYTPENAFTYLIISNDKLKEGEHTFWKDDTQLNTSETSFMQGGMPQPDFPNENNKMPTPPELEDDTQRPQRPEMPNKDFPQMPEGERPEMPEGMENMDPPTMQNDLFSNAEKTTVFMIKNGENQFANVDHITR